VDFPSRIALPRRGAGQSGGGEGFFGSLKSIFITSLVCWLRCPINQANTSRVRNAIGSFEGLQREGHAASGWRPMPTRPRGHLYLAIFILAIATSGTLSSHCAQVWSSIVKDVHDLVVSVFEWFSELVCSVAGWFERL
jgi:hypothetical protein